MAEDKQPVDEKQERLAAALRENLRRRKAQAKQRTMAENSRDSKSD